MASTNLTWAGVLLAAALAINRFNSQYRYARAYLDDEMDLYTQFDFEVLHAAAGAHIASQVGL